MDLDDLKAIAEQFRPIADDMNRVRDLANQICNAHEDGEVDELCESLHDAPNGSVVRSIIDEVRGRK